MATQRQDRRGTTSEHNVFTGAVGEITVDTDLKEPRVHDGSRAGGFIIPNFSSLQKRLYSYDPSPGGTATAITCSTEVDAIALTSGLQVTLKMASAATGASTLTWGSLTTKNIKKYSGGAKVDIEADDWVAVQEITFWYDGTDWVAQIGGSGGGAAIVDSQNFSSNSNLNFPSVFQDGFNYEIELISIQMASDAHALIRFTDDNGSTYETAGYAHQYNAVEAGTGVSEAGSTIYADGMGASLAYSNSNFADYAINQKMTVLNPAAADEMTGYFYNSTYVSSGGIGNILINGGGRYDVASALTGFQVVTTSGNVVSGIVSVREIPIT